MSETKEGRGVGRVTKVADGVHCLKFKDLVLEIFLYHIADTECECCAGVRVKFAPGSVIHFYVSDQR